jgi:predicted metalloprotease with PDZ domain
MKLFILALAAAFSLTACSADRTSSGPVQDPTATYHVSFAPDKQSVHISAVFSIDEPLLFMYVQSTKELPNGEATFVKNISLKDGAGNPLALKDIGNGDWEHSAERNDRVTLSYEIELQHHRYPWPGGIDEVAFVRDDAVFFTGDALFILPGEQLKDIDVTVDVPAGWNISVPWKKTGGNTFRAMNSRDLVVNCGMVGTHDVRFVQVDSFQLQLAIGGTQKRSVDLFVKTMTPALRAYSALFGGSRFSDYLIVIHDDVQSDGGAFRSSFSQVIDGVANNNSVVTWGHTMLHEIFHLWNGNAIIPSTQEEWFKEGATDYMTVKYLYSLNIFDKTNFFKAMENTQRKYILAQLMDRLTNSPSVSVREAGNDKAKNRLMVYGGGSLAAFMLDVELRERTGRKRGIEDLLRMMYDEFGRTDTKYTQEDIIRISSEVAGTDMRWFFDRYVNGRERFDMRPYYTKVGLQLDTFVEEIYLSKISDASTDQQMLFRSMFRN